MLKAKVKLRLNRHLWNSPWLRIAHNFNIFQFSDFARDFSGLYYYANVSVTLLAFAASRNCTPVKYALLSCFCLL